MGSGHENGDNSDGEDYRLVGDVYLVVGPDGIEGAFATEGDAAHYVGLMDDPEGYYAVEMDTWTLPGNIQ